MNLKKTAHYGHDRLKITAISRIGFEPIKLLAPQQIVSGFVAILEVAMSALVEKLIYMLINLFIYFCGVPHHVRVCVQQPQAISAPSIADKAFNGVQQLGKPPTPWTLPNTFLDKDHIYALKQLRNTETEREGDTFSIQGHSTLNKKICILSRTYNNSCHKGFHFSPVRHSQLCKSLCNTFKVL